MICFLVYAIIGILVWQIDRKQLTNRLFFVVCVLLSIWAALFVPMSLAPSAEKAAFFRRLSTLTWGSIYSLLLHFFIILTGNGRWLRKIWRITLLHLPAAVTIYLYFWADPVTVSAMAFTHFGWAFLNPPDQSLLLKLFFNIYYISYVLAGLILLTVWMRKTAYTREKHQARIMISGQVLALILGSLTDVILPHMNRPPMGIVSILIPIGGIWFALQKYQLINLYPEHAVPDILRIMNEGLIMVDDASKIRQINQGALKMLGFPSNHLIIDCP